MGNHSFGDVVPEGDDGARKATVTHYFTAGSWIEGAAVHQLAETAGLPGMISVAGFPDLHPGKYGPVGMVALSQRLYPQLIGNDIGCGMSFFELSLPLRKLRVEKAAEQLRRLEQIDLGDMAARLAEHDLSPDMCPQSLGTIGGGNHFCELQAVDEVFEGEMECVVDRQKLYLLVHSGSRSVGANLFDLTLAGDEQLRGGLAADSAAAVEWLAGSGECVRWASLNRRIVAERVARALRADLSLVADIPHNLVRATASGFLHYKGAAAIGEGVVAPVAGSRATRSYLVKGLAGAERSHWGISHGAGRKYDRKAMHGRVGGNRSERDALRINDWGGVAICEDRNLLIEEAAGAYKDAAKVVADLDAFGLVQPLAAMRPLVTYKNAQPQPRVREKAKWERTTIRRMRHG
ncbi:RNA ligase RtcB family protein [Ensifer adhaerens]|uniref:RNA ligase RtcB family protein n=1 Tax=Ensifer adhaerens TaxID=106592 RepID=UPI0023A9F09A|nr:RNA ligase RtcB family protein [Ensifer adhaerens]WDZ77481.1 RNA ligase RtcB family protein [Ensifer adhaerens]